MKSSASAIRKGVNNAARRLDDEYDAVKVAVSGGWTCKAHDVSRHDYFISYRVSQDKVLAITLFHELNKRKRGDGRQTTAFLDFFCLRDGEPWQDGFLHGVAKTKVAVLLISEGSLVNIKKANEKQDNVLLEYEHALAILDKKGWEKMRIMPVFVGHHEEVTRANGTMIRAYIKLSIPRLDEFPNEPHNTTAAPEGYKRTIRETMQAIFALQGHFVNPEERLDALYHDLDVLLG